jgi:hypothetical protein
LPKHRDDVADVVHRRTLLQSHCTCMCDVLREGQRQETLISRTPQASRPGGFATLLKVSLF